MLQLTCRFITLEGKGVVSERSKNEYGRMGHAKGSGDVCGV